MLISNRCKLWVALHNVGGVPRRSQHTLRRGACEEDKDVSLGPSLQHLCWQKWGSPSGPGRKPNLNDVAAEMMVGLGPWSPPGFLFPQTDGFRLEFRL